MNQLDEAGFSRHLLQFFGSLKLAMLLLATLILGCIVGTIVESRFDTAVAWAYVYDSPWFIAWLALLCLNLLAVIFTRYPWKKRHLGFVLAHIGIITILIGSIIGRLWGVEGNVTLLKGESPTAHLVLQDKLLEAHTGDPSGGLAVVIRTETHRPSANRPVEMEVDGIRIAATDYAEELGMRTVVEEGTEGSPALFVSMQSAMVGKPIEHWLVLGDPKRQEANLGPATIRVAHDIGGTAKKTSGPEAAQSESCREVRFEFARLPGMGIARPLEGPSTGAGSRYRHDGSPDGKGVLQLEIAGKPVELAVAKILGKRTPIKGTPWKIEVLQYFADFRMENKKPVSVSETPNNPAVMFEITGPASAATGDASAPHGHPPAGGSAETSPPSGVNTLTLFISNDRKLRFEASSKRHGTTSGPVEAGKEFMPQWADWRVEVKQIVDRAVVRDQLEPVSPEAARSIGSPGLKVRAEKDGQTDVRWLPLGSPAHLDFGGKSLHMAFGHRIHPLPFGIVLENFEVDRDEGTQNPAGFKSHVRFIDPKNRVVMEREIWMNNPANFPDFPGAGLLGTSYKFSQASWNPNNLNQTTLQVLRDPGWSLKWIGSLMLVGGIFTMFYIRPFMEKNS